MVDDIEVELLQRCKQGDIHAFEKLFYLCKDKVYHLAWHMTRSPEDAEEVMQEVFLRVYEGLPTFRAESRFNTWLYRIAVNCCLAWIKRRDRSRMISLHDGQHITDSSGQSPETLLMCKELAAEIEKAFRKLSDGERLILTLAAVEQMPYREIAEILHCSLSAVKVRVHRARLAFQRLMEPYLET